MNGTSKSMSHPKIAAPGEAFNTVWNVEQIAHAALSLTPQEGPQRCKEVLKDYQGRIRGTKARAGT